MDKTQHRRVEGREVGESKDRSAHTYRTERTRRQTPSGAQCDKTIHPCERAVAIPQWKCITKSAIDFRGRGCKPKCCGPQKAPLYQCWTVIGASELDLGNWSSGPKPQDIFSYKVGNTDRRDDIS